MVSRGTAPFFHLVMLPIAIPKVLAIAVGVMLFLLHNVTKLFQNMVISFLRGNIIVLQIFVDKTEFV